MKTKFWRWLMTFGAIGLLIPIVLLIEYFVVGRSFGAWAARLWPSSVMFLALDAPGTSASTIAFVYALAFVENIVLYSLVGALTWPLAYLVLRVREFRAGLARTR